MQSPSPPKAVPNIDPWTQCMWAHEVLRLGFPRHHYVVLGTKDMALSPNPVGFGISCTWSCQRLSQFRPPLEMVLQVNACACTFIESLY